MISPITTGCSDSVADSPARQRPGLDGHADRLRRPRQRWLVTILLIDLGALYADRLLLGPDGFAVAAGLRLGVVTPLLLLAIALNRRSGSRALLDAANAVATFAFFVVATTIGLWAAEPAASRYMVAALFIMFSATLFATLPPRASHALLGLSMTAYTAIVASPHRLAPAEIDLDLIGLGIALALVSLTIRHEQDAHRAALRRLRRVDAERAAALQRANAQLAELSATDPLTGLFNRRYLDQAIAHDAASLVPTQGSGVLMIDVDHFKQFNDHAGHAGGDHCLRLIAAALRGSLRSDDDIAARYGGEEFAVILPDADRAETIAVAERLRRAVAALAIPHPALGAGRFVSISIGATVTAPGETITDAIECADRMLYCAKQAGRDRIYA